MWVPNGSYSLTSLTQDNQTTIASARAAFQISAAISDSQVRLSSRFDEFGDICVELTPDVWNEIAPMLKVVEVSTTPRALGRIVVPEIAQSQQTVNHSQARTKNNPPTTVHVIGGPIDLTIPISDACTPSELRELVFQRESRLPKRLAFHHQDIQLDNDTKPLREYGVVDQSIIAMITSVQVYVTTPARSKVPMRITLYADVSSLKLLIRDRLDVPMNKQILMCAGEELVEGSQLGSYPQVAHNCQIVVDVMPTEDPGKDQALYLFCVEVKSAWATDDDDEVGELYYVLPTSTILDLKVLIHNLSLISPSRQRLEFRGQTLDDEQNMNEAQVEHGNTLILHLASQAT
ncbi:unnamed protein product [Rhizoctonia solani]|uniref:Ubiquitin-like domain-containing protein n=1 Tax=Rhizoctonia solani TaxID=456999 RepID=A0A8H3B023_9AGAM|nr:unnamed protein product [Rhizoctonia solani]